MTEIHCSFDEAKVRARIRQDLGEAQKALDAQIIADSSYFVPHDTGTLEDSATATSKIGTGVIQWAVPYARRQYYGVNFDHSKQRNASACAKWFEAAKARYLSDWIALVQRYVRRR